MKRWRIRRSSELRARRLRASARYAMSRRAVLLGGISAAAALGSRAFAADEIEFKVDGNGWFIVTGAKTNEFDPKKLGATAIFKLGNRINPAEFGILQPEYWKNEHQDLELKNLQIGSFYEKKHTFRISRKSDKAPWMISAMTTGKGEYISVRLDRWAFSARRLKQERLPILFKNNYEFLKSALSRGVSVDGDKVINVFLRSDLGWIAAAGAGTSLYIESIKLDDGIRFGLLGADKAKRLTPVLGKFIHGKAVGEGEIVLGQKNGISVVARFTTATVIVERPKSGALHLTEITGSGKLEIRRAADGQKVAAFAAKAITVVVTRGVGGDADIARTATISLADGPSEAVIDGVPFTVVSHAPEVDFSVGALNDALTLFTGQIQVQQLCLSVPGADFSRMGCGITPLRFEVGGVASSVAGKAGEDERAAKSIDTNILKAEPLRLIGRLGELGESIVVLAATQIPTMLKSGLEDVCAGAAETVTLVTASALQGETAADVQKVLSLLSKQLRDIKQGIVNKAGWPAPARVHLAGWVDGRVTDVELLQQTVNEALSALASFKVDSLFPNSCKAPDATPFSILQDIDRLRGQVLTSLKTALGQTAAIAAGFKTAIDDLRKAIDELVKSAAAEKREEVKKEIEAVVTQLEAACLKVLRGWSAAVLSGIEASTPLGAIASARQAEAVASAKKFFKQVSDSLDAGSVGEDAKSENLKKTSTAIKAAKAFFDALPANQADVDKALLDFTKASNTLAEAEEAAKDFSKAVTAVIQAQDAGMQLALQTARGLVLANSPNMVSGILKALSPILASVFDAIVAVNDMVEKGRAEAIDALTPKELAPVNVGGIEERRNLDGLAALLKMLPQDTDLVRCPFYVEADPGATCPVGVNPEQMNDVLDKEGALIAELAGRLKTESPLRDETVDKIRALAGDWRDNGPAVARLVRQLLDLTRNILSGDLGRHINLAAYKAKIEDELRKLLPTKSTIDHSLKLTIAPRDFLEKIFLPKDPDNCHLVITTSSTFDFVTRTVRSKTEGKLDAFSIKLLGDLDIATLEFSEATFKAENDGPPAFNIAFKSFKPGEAIKFIEPLQKFLSPGESGPRIEPLKESVGIAASYGVDIGIISTGAFSFANVVLNAVAELPFDEKEARFRVGLGRRDAPFLISALPYTGGGYFALIATGKQIVGFEASFEFGGGGAFNFGPLTGQGRITTGIYIRQSGEGAYMDGFFYCGGSAKIAFFGTSASLSVRMTQVDGAMQGQATFKYAFSMGIRDFEYSVRVWHKRDSKSQQSASLYVVPTTDHALLDISPLTGRLPDSLMNMRPRLAGFGGGAGAAATCQPIRAAYFKVAEPPKDYANYYACQLNTALCQSQDWLTYRDYFDLSLLTKVPLDD